MATRQKEKAAKRQENRDKRPKAIARYVRISPRKAGAVMNLLRGKKVSEAEAILMGTPKAASEILDKLLKSAVANAENNMEMNRDELFIAEAFANQGPTLKRFRPRAQGRATRIRKRTSHLTIILDRAK